MQTWQSSTRNMRNLRYSVKTSWHKTRKPWNDRAHWGHSLTSYCFLPDVSIALRMKVCSGLPGYSRSKGESVPVQLGISVLYAVRFKKERDLFTYCLKWQEYLCCCYSVSTQGGAVLSIIVYYPCYYCVWLYIQMKDDIIVLSISGLGCMQQGLQ